MNFFFKLFLSSVGRCKEYFNASWYAIALRIDQARVRLRTSFLTKLIAFEDLITSWENRFDHFAIKWSLKWYLFFVLHKICAIICISIGFAIGTLWTIYFCDDGLERVMDVYNYMKNPPKS